MYLIYLFDWYDIGLHVKWPACMFSSIPEEMGDIDDIDDFCIHVCVIYV